MYCSQRFVESASSACQPMIFAVQSAVWGQNQRLGSKKQPFLGLGVNSNDLESASTIAADAIEIEKSHALF